MPTPEERAEVEAILASQAFAKSPNLARLLQYICDMYFEGKAPDLKEYNIGVEALGRPPEFDPAISSIVRVEVHRMREKLRRYYETEGAHDPLMIVLQVGHYIPQFIRRGEVPNHTQPEPSPAGGELPRPPETAGPFLPERHAGERGPGVSPRPTELLRTTASEDAVKSGQARRPLVRLTYLAPIIGISAVIFGISAWKLRPTKPAEAMGARSEAAGRLATGASTGEREIRIIAGYSKDSYIDRMGNVWRGDRYFRGGTMFAPPRQLIARTLDPTLFHTFRYGEFSYDIPLQPGVYELRLYFAETHFGPGTFPGGGESSRVFFVELNGQPLLTQFDPFRDAGGNNIAHVRVFKDVTPAADGFLHLKFLAVVDQPLINALEIVPGMPGRLHPIRIVAQENHYTDREGNVWSADRYSSGGRLVRRKVAVEGTADPDLYAGERFGNFSYALPVSRGKYRITLYFAETYFGAENAGFGGVGDRIFDLYCNGVALLRNFDVFKEAGGVNRALVRTFPGLEANAAGQILLSFVPARNYACVNAIEVIDESK